MNIVKFQDIVMSMDLLMNLPEGHYFKVIVKTMMDEENPIEVYVWADETHSGLTPEEFVEYFNKFLRNKFAYAIRWEVVVPMNRPTTDELYPTGNPFDLDDMDDSYVNFERKDSSISSYYKFKDLMDWMDQVRTLTILQNDRTKYNYLNEFTPDDDITVEELKVFRTWLASILLANTPMIESWDNPEMLMAMLKYYKQNMKDATTDILVEFSKYMTTSVLVAGTGVQGVLNMATLGLSSGCGCNNYMQGVGNVVVTGGCDPLQMYRNAIYNYMVETFSCIEYWMDQVEICIEMKKYIEGILKVGLPLGSKIIDPYADCGCNTFDSDSQTRYKKMLEALIQALTYIIEGKVSGNRNYISTAFSNWATYLYEYMYWV